MLFALAAGRLNPVHSPLLVCHQLFHIVRVDIVLRLAAIFNRELVPVIVVVVDSALRVNVKFNG